MKFNYFGHSCFSVEAAGKTLLFDPFFTNNPLAGKVNLNQIRADYVLLSHGHGDHIGDTVEIVKQTGATLVAPFETATWIANQGVTTAVPMNHGGKTVLGPITVKLTNAIHSSSLPDGSYGGNPAGFLVSANHETFYYSGDTALTYDMKLIGETVKLKFAILPVGDHFTMGYEDALLAADFIKCNQIIGVHFDTFPPIKLDHAKAIEHFRRAGKTLHLLKCGDSIDL